MFFFFVTRRRYADDRRRMDMKIRPDVFLIARAQPMFCTDPDEPFILSVNFCTLIKRHFVLLSHTHT